MKPSEELLNRIWDVLVDYAGAYHFQRSHFISDFTREGEYYPKEWRFQGFLGFGGKFWIDNMRVTCYYEDETPWRLQIIEQTNYELNELLNLTNEIN